ncbi:MAG: hypothetical protein ACJ77F_14260, partial [Chloroflexota bacterium]
AGRGLRRARTTRSRVGARGKSGMAQLNSYGHAGVKNMYGPMFNGDTATVYDAADTATWNTTVP